MTGIETALLIGALVLSMMVLALVHILANDQTLQHDTGRRMRKGDIYKVRQNLWRDEDTTVRILSNNIFRSEFEILKGEMVDKYEIKSAKFIKNEEIRNSMKMPRIIKFTLLLFLLRILWDLYYYIPAIMDKLL